MTATRRGDVGRQLPTLVAGTLAVLGVGLALVSVLIWASQGFPRLPQSLSRTPVAILPSQLLAVVCIVVGALLGHRVPRNPVGWLLLAAGCSMVLIVPVALVVAHAQQAFRPAPDSVRQLAWLVSSIPTPVVLASLALAGLCFPDGRLPSRWQRGAAVLVVAAAVSFWAATAFDPTGLVWYPTIANPFAAPPELERAFAFMRPASAVLMLAAVLSVVASVALRYRGGGEVTRAQLRWIVYAALTFALSSAPFILARYVVATSDTAGETVMALANLGGIALPVAAAFAITRYRLFGIDRLISRTLVYVPLVGILGGLYAAAVALFQRLFVAVTGSPSDVPLLIAVFVIAAAFTPLRKAMEHAVDSWARAGQASSSDADERSGVARQTEAPFARGEPMAARQPPVPVTSTGRSPRDRGDGASSRPAGADPPATSRSAAALAAVRRLESRIAAGPAAADDTRETQTLAIDDDGSVGCPAGSRVPFSTCLGCPYLTSINLSPPEVRCGRTLGGARSGVH